jgi:hypothetical protein
MKKIMSKEEIEKKNKKLQIILGVVLMGLMVLSTAGFAIMSGDNNTEEVSEIYQGFKFVKLGSYWTIELNNQIYYFQYLPQELENLEISGFYDLNQYSEKSLYYVENNIASQLISQNLQGKISKIQEACLIGYNCDTNKSIEGNLPQKTCSDNLIIFSEELESSSELKTSVKKIDNCVYLSGEYIKASDAFMYKILRVM